MKVTIEEQIKIGDGVYRPSVLGIYEMDQAPIKGEYIVLRATAHIPYGRNFRVRERLFEIDYKGTPSIILRVIKG